MSNIVKRGITGAVYVLSVIAAVYLPPVVCFIYFGVISMIGLHEFYRNMRQTTTVSPNPFGYLLGLAAYVLLGGEIFWSFHRNVILYALALLLLLLFIVPISELYRKKEKPFTNIAYTLLGVMYVVVPLSCANILRINLFPSIVLMSIFIFAWCNDTFAYLTGMWLGKHKLFERISPKKTWEGCIGGVVSVIIASVIIVYFNNTVELYQILPLAIITSVVGVYGDLIESMWKRQIGIKDSGNILPGHGGILDRFDIMLLVLPACTMVAIVLFKVFYRL
ncbi:MAG: phosphatidate cytidylyltransferase [Bacteroidales bacterium]|nr:phosphatidate cytidylyltransferase [Bacteroidales bacterium]